MQRKGAEWEEQKLPFFKTKNDEEEEYPIILEKHFLEFLQSRAIGCKYRVLTTEWPAIVVQFIKETDKEKAGRTNDLDKCLVNI